MVGGGWVKTKNRVMLRSKSLSFVFSELDFAWLWPWLCLTLTFLTLTWPSPDLHLTWTWAWLCVYGPDVFIVTTNVPRSWHLDKRRTVRLWPCFPRPQYWTYIGHPGESGAREFWKLRYCKLDEIFLCRELTRNFEWAFQQSNYSNCLSTESEFSEKLVITLSAFNGSVQGY